MPIPCYHVFSHQDDTDAYGKEVVYVDTFQTEDDARRWILNDFEKYVPKKDNEKYWPPKIYVGDECKLDDDVRFIIQPSFLKTFP